MQLMEAFRVQATPSSAMDSQVTRDPPILSARPTRSASAMSSSTIDSKPLSLTALENKTHPSNVDVLNTETEGSTVTNDDLDMGGPPDFRYRHLSDIMATLGGLWRRRLYTDFTLVVEGQAVRCHKVILAAASPYFHSRLFTGRRESPIDKIFMTNVNRSILDLILDFIYTGECALNLDNVEDILKTATLFQLSALQDMADLYLSENIDVNNCLRLFKLANTTASSLTREQARWVINNQFASLWQTPMFRQLSCKELISVIEKNELVVPDEDCVCNAILTWLEADKDKRRFVLSEILRHVDLPKQRKEYIRQTLETDKIVKEDVVCQRLMRRVKRSQQSSLEDSISKNIEKNLHAIKDDVILFIGGIINEDTKFKCKQQVLAFNLEFRKFYTMASLPMGCDSGVACCRLGSDIIVSGLGESRQGLVRYIASQNLWRVLAPMTIGRRGHAVVSHNNFIFVLGGMVDQELDGTRRITSMVEKYDIKRNRWSFASTLPESVWGLSAVVNGTKIVTFGGYQSRDVPTTSVQTYDMKSGLSRVTSQLPFPVALTQAVMCDDTVYIVCPTGNILKTTDCWRFQSGSTLPNFKRAMFGTTIHRDRLFLAGGKFSQEAYDDMMMVDLSTNTLMTLPEKLPLPAYGFGCVALQLSRGFMVKTAFE